MAATLAHDNGFYYGEHTGEYIEIQALRIHITYAGEGDPVLLIHGAGQNSYTWRHQFRALAERYFVVAVDMIGYGYSDKPDLTYTIEENSEFLLALLNTLRIKQTNIIAMGSGYFTTVKNYRDNISHLYVLGTCYYLYRLLGSYIHLTYN